LKEGRGGSISLMRSLSPKCYAATGRVFHDDAGRWRTFKVRTRGEWIGSNRLRFLGRANINIAAIVAGGRRFSVAGALGGEQALAVQHCIIKTSLHNGVYVCALMSIHRYTYSYTKLFIFILSKGV
jgi:hypothetical protein